MPPAIEVNRLGKRFDVRPAGASSLPWYRRVLGGGEATEPFWALRDISFEVARGESLGIIGRNGAGKSTLLKILARILRPTEGRAVIRGRVAALLEIATGFNRELSGRANVFAGGAILGMSHGEIASRFDEIVAFAGLESFIDAPIKTYSTGMRMRLAFAVASHVEADVLLLDEVLAVGDAAFQQKCLGRVRGMFESGRTVLLVSHSMSSIVTFCDRCVMLDRGGVARIGASADVTKHYEEMMHHTAAVEADGGTAAGAGAAVGSVRVDLSDDSGRTARDEWAEEGARYGDGAAKFTSLSLQPLDGEGAAAVVVRTGGGLSVEVELLAREAIDEANVALIVYGADGYRLIDANTALRGFFCTMAAGERAVVRFVLPNLLLKPGAYRLGLWMGRRNVATHDGISFAHTFEVAQDTGRIVHDQVFPGPYQADFTAELTREVSSGGSPGGRVGGLEAARAD